MYKRICIPFLIDESLRDVDTGLSRNLTLLKTACASLKPNISSAHRVHISVERFFLIPLGTRRAFRFQLDQRTQIERTQLSFFLNDGGMISGPISGS
jgi:hypothetical protein